jgi:hypothetical protein
VRSQRTKRTPPHGSRVKQGPTRDRLSPPITKVLERRVDVYFAGADKPAQPLIGHCLGHKSDIAPRGDATLSSPLARRKNRLRASASALPNRFDRDGPNSTVIRRSI